MDLVVPPGVVGEDDIGFVFADHPADVAAEIHGDLEFAVLMTEEDEALHADGLPGGALLSLAHRRHLLRRHLWVPRSLLTAGDDAVRHVRPALDPRRERLIVARRHEQTRLAILDERL